MANRLNSAGNAADTRLSSAIKVRCATEPVRLVWLGCMDDLLGPYAPARVVQDPSRQINNLAARGALRTAPDQPEA
jgi:hypothetical protein